MRHALEAYRIDRETLDTETQGPDRVLRSLALLTTALSIVSYIYFANQGVTQVYKDAISHLEIARRVVDSPTPGLAQLGGVWLPLPHILSLPFVWLDLLYYSGFAGSIISMVSYIITSASLYKLAHTLTGYKPAGVVAAAVFALNPNVLYMQSTAMTELPLFACMVGMVYGVQRWIQTDEHKYLMVAGTCSILGTLTRYEAWVLFAALTGVICIVMWSKRYEIKRAEGTLLAFLLIAGLGIVSWGVWNLLIFGNPLYFQVGEYAKPSLWVGEGEPSVGSWSVALKTYSIATLENIHWLGVVLLLLGVVAMLVKERNRLQLLPSLSLLSLFPFFVFALEGGQRPLHIEEISGDLYNIRFGLLMILPAAIAAGYLAGTLSAVKVMKTYAAGALVVLSGVYLLFVVVSDEQIVTLKEPASALETGYTADSDGTSDFLARHYSGGKILMESFGNELVLFNARIPFGDNISEGSYKLWEPALEDPVGNGIDWIVMRGGSQPDKTFTALHDSPTLKSYELVYDNNTYYIYKERS